VIAKNCFLSVGFQPSLRGQCIALSSPSYFGIAQYRSDGSVLASTK